MGYGACRGPHVIQAPISFFRGTLAVPEHLATGAATLTLACLRAQRSKSQSPVFPTICYSAYQDISEVGSRSFAQTDHGSSNATEKLKRRKHLTKQRLLVAFIQPSIISTKTHSLLSVKRRTYVLGLMIKLHIKPCSSP